MASPYDKTVQEIGAVSTSIKSLKEERDDTNLRIDQQIKSLETQLYSLSQSLTEKLAAQAISPSKRFESHGGRHKRSVDETATTEKAFHHRDKRVAESDAFTSLHYSIGDIRQMEESTAKFSNATVFVNTTAATAAITPTINVKDKDATELSNETSELIEIGNYTEISQDLPIVVYIDGRRAEISCNLCGANAIKSDKRFKRFFAGIKGLTSHMHTHSKDDDSLKEKRSSGSVARNCKKRYLDEKEVEMIKRGKRLQLQPPITMRLAADSE